MAVRTSVLGRLNLPGILTGTLFTVPAGQTWIIKDILVTNNNAAANSVVLNLVNPAGTLAVVIFGPTIAAGVGVELQTNAVADPGSQLQAFASVGNVNIWVSGTRLVGVAT